MVRENQAASRPAFCAEPSDDRNIDNSSKAEDRVLSESKQTIVHNLFFGRVRNNARGISPGGHRRAVAWRVAMDGQRHRCQAAGVRGELDFPRLFRGLHDDLREAAEQAALPVRRAVSPRAENIRLVRRRIAVADAEDFARPGQLK